MIRTIGMSVLLVLFLSLVQAQEQPNSQEAQPVDASQPGEVKSQNGEAKADTEPHLPANSQEGGDPNVDPNAYKIGPEDQLMIRVWKEQELSGPVTVRPDGKITILLLNEVHAAGVSPMQLANTIREGLEEKYMKNPEVSVTVVKVNSKRYFIQGEVLRSGTFPLLVPTSVLEALVNAGGFREFADTKHIVIMRGDKRLKFNYKDVIKGKKMDQNIQLENGDLIIVP